MRKGECLLQYSPGEKMAVCGLAGGARAKVGLAERPPVILLLSPAILAKICWRSLVVVGTLFHPPS